MDYEFHYSYVPDDDYKPIAFDSEPIMIELDDDDESAFELKIDPGTSKTTIKTIPKGEKIVPVERGPSRRPIIRQITTNGDGVAGTHKVDCAGSSCGNRLPQIRVIKLPSRNQNNHNIQDGLRSNGPPPKTNGFCQWSNGNSTAALVMPAISPAGAGESPSGKPTIKPSQLRPADPQKTSKLYYTARTTTDISQRTSSEVLERVGAEVRAENTRLRGDNARLTGELRRLTDQLQRAEADRERLAKMVTRIRSRPYRKMLPIDVLSNHARHNRERLVVEMVAGSYPEKPSSPAAVEAFIAKVRERMAKEADKYAKAKTQKMTKKKALPNDESNDEKK